MKILTAQTVELLMLKKHSTNSVKLNTRLPAHTTTNQPIPAVAGDTQRTNMNKHTKEYIVLLPPEVEVDIPELRRWNRKPVLARMKDRGNTDCVAVYSRKLGPSLLPMDWLYKPLRQG